MRMQWIVVPALMLSACATVSGYLDGRYNTPTFPPLDAAPETIALVSRAEAPGTQLVLIAVDDEPIMVNPEGVGEGLWSKQVALAPGQHAVMTRWRQPGQYSPASLLCKADYAAGRHYVLNYEIKAPARARMWISDAADNQKVADCEPYAPPPVAPSWPFNPA